MFWIGSGRTRLKGLRRIADHVHCPFFPLTRASPQFQRLQKFAVKLLHEAWLSRVCAL
jgi:hypothetical protein